MECSLLETTIMPLITQEDTRPVIEWMKINNLLHQNIDCEHCKAGMVFVARKDIADKFQWKCFNTNCSKRYSKISIRTGSFFAKSHLELKKWIYVMYLWAIGTSEANSCLQVNVSPRVMVDIYNFFREICSFYFEKYPIKLGGEGQVVEIDESCLLLKVKDHPGRSPAKPMWVFGIVERNDHDDASIGYMEIVEKQDAATLIPIIQKVVLPSSTIHSNEWESYRSLQSQNYEHKSVNHSITFVDKKTGIHSQAIESYWSKHKYMIKKMKSCNRKMLKSYLYEMMWRDRFGKDPFTKLCDHIALCYDM